MKGLKLRQFSDKSDWITGTFEGLTFHAKHFDEPSEAFGIDGGRVSKLSVYDETGSMILNYDRGWDMKPDSKYFNKVNALLRQLEQLPKRIIEPMKSPQCHAVLALMDKDKGYEDALSMVMDEFRAQLEEELDKYI